MRTMTVSDLVRGIKRALGAPFGDVEVEGEVTNLRASAAGHRYFTLSDDASSIACVLFRGDALGSADADLVADGDRVVVGGGVDVYARRGAVQVVARSIARSGEGGLALEFERLRARLAREGLFDASAKAPVPSAPRTIAVVTAPGGAALQDFLKVFRRRSLAMDVIVVPSLVQGEAAPASLRAALERTVRHSMENRPVDVVVLARGGGSLEDLWAFNDEGLAWDIHACPIPVVSAVGHQTDRSISDFVADARCETPTAAAELLSQGQTTVRPRLEHLRAALARAPAGLLAGARRRLDRAHPGLLAQLLTDAFHRARARLGALDPGPRAQALLGVRERRLLLDELAGRLESAAGGLAAGASARLESSGALLRGLDPRGVLARGYAYVAGAGGLITSAARFRRLPDGAPVTVAFADGEGRARKA